MYTSNCSHLRLRLRCILYDIVCTHLVQRVPWPGELLELEALLQEDDGDERQHEGARAVVCAGARGQDRIITTEY